MTERALEVQRSKAHDESDGATARQAVAADAPTDLRSALRHATTDLHHHLDRAPEQRELLAPDLTLERYAAIMTKHHHALAIGEAALADDARACPQDVPPYRPRLAALEADLVMLDPSWCSTFGGQAQKPATDDARALGRYLGTRYVLEGSTQGAVAIARRLQKNLPELSATAFGYWRAQAEEAPTWQALAEALAKLPAHGPMASAAIEAAHEAFTAFLHAFDLDAPVPSRPRSAHVEDLG